MATEIKVPTLGESVTEATIGQWFKKPGDRVELDETIAELETDKVTVEVPAPAAGVLSDIAAQEGETVEVGAVIGAIGEGDGASAKTSSAKSAPAKAEAKSEPKKAEAAGKLVEITVPAAGESVTEATVGEIFRKVGDSVSVDESLLELETDKAAQEIPSPVAGVIREMAVKPGDEVKVGALLLKIEEGAAAGSGASASGSAAGGSGTDETPRRQDQAEAGRPPAPSAAKLMREKGLKDGDVEGSGKQGQVLKSDVLDAIAKGGASSAKDKPQQTPRASSAPDDAAREERVKMTRLRQTIARRLKDAQDTAAMLTTFNEVDMTATMELRKKYKDLFEKKHGVKLGFMGFFTKAVCHALKEIPAVNAEIDGNEIVYKNFCHIGMAVGTDKGLVVPVIRDADQMSIAEVEKELSRLARAARDGKLGMSDMQGGTFTITNGGVYGSLMSTPIINAPQSGILGMHKIQERPMAIGGQVVIRPMMYLALSYDHRIVDGKEAVTFLVRVKESLEDPERLVLDL
ncbi:2-oxoglutarate dehydrogenase complex dihydrolipoyllysine-residue succinyltransferase [Jiella sp. MQZ9-1]|uniref:Dihydrolipoyllysine-residue succinyltransferase component of 2-oxoglutarate dehydrogenase complex n=1 Tax=Jiella flava TaxID=2816857 RepID=A0A939FXU7_9HYPH|nr:2-oxoglutarate dehydrogenase complex dihydrolipoyllysine-residue succinyltransferase [Jiella flava]MBO0663495.1 2-oxoglutarate dehydrogenase complex dihydrolipoyllysine-residue succinyltransferase [Jiella flava]MCD2472070.1 2-oxoglutarate dehydrogenase complex dihydrolipoyllysine-residue succinyltransferase [Jiella flava]